MEVLRFITELLKGNRNGERESDLVTPIPTPETALLSLQVGQTFKPHGRLIMPQDCVIYDDCFLPEETVPLNDESRIIVFDLIYKLFEKEGPDDDTGIRAKNAYCEYVRAARKGDKEAMEEADNTFRDIASFSLREVIGFENQVRSLHNIKTI